MALKLGNTLNTVVNRWGNACKPVGVVPRCVGPRTAVPWLLILLTMLLPLLLAIWSRGKPGMVQSVFRRLTKPFLSLSVLVIQAEQGSVFSPGGGWL